eukprot:7812907-Alexandrium_andersonii.AAC.1
MGCAAGAFAIGDFAAKGAFGPQPPRVNCLLFDDPLSSCTDTGRGGIESSGRRGAFGAYKRSVRARVRACVLACVRACALACLRAC